MSLTKKLEQSLAERRAISLDIPAYSDYQTLVMVVGLSRSVVIMAEVDEFEFDCWSAFPRRFVRGYRDGEFEECNREVLRQSKGLQGLRVPAGLKKCESIRDVLEWTKSRRIWPVVETHYTKAPDDSAFYIGPVTELRRYSFKILCYGGTGEWEKDYELDYRDVMRVGTGDPYSTHFNNYMRRHNPPPGTT